MKRTEKILVVVDMQNDFIDGVLDNPAAKAIIPEIVKMIREWDGKVVATRDTHFENTYKNSIEGQRLPIHCVHGTHGWQIQEDIQKALDEKGAKIIDKHNFGYINWPKALFDIDSTDQDAVAALVADWDITICDTGTCTDICDASAFTMQRAWFPRAIIQVAEKATAASFNNEHQAAALEIARSMLCDVV